MNQMIKTTGTKYNINSKPGNNAVNVSKVEPPIYLFVCNKLYTKKPAKCDRRFLYLY